MKITLNIQKIIILFILIASLLIIANSIMLLVYFTIDNPQKFDFIRMIDLDQEANLPTLFSSAILLISGFLFYLLSKNPQEIENKNKPYWFGLSLIFTFLAFDESAKIHETLGDLSENFIHASGYLYYPWVALYGTIVVVLGIFYLRFFWKMPKELFWSFMTAAILFLSGAIGFELLGAKEASLHGSDSMNYCIYYTIEESLEMFGVIYLIKILLELLKKNTLQIKS